MRPRRNSPIVRLVDADPTWVGRKGRKGLGLHCRCPIHEDCWVYVPFSNPLDGEAPSGHGWLRSGETFKTLTLSPSIRRQGGDDGCEWHGFIRSGRFETCGDSQ